MGMASTFIRHSTLLAGALYCAAAAFGQKRIDCQNGEVHYEIDVEKLKLEYKGQSFQTTLSGLAGLGVKAAIQPTTLQAADAATQQWNQLLQGLAAGYNSCAVTQAAYAEGIGKIYPRLKDDATELEKIRQDLAGSREVDRKHFQSILDRYFANLREFARAGNNSIVDAIRAVVDQAAVRIEGRIDDSSEKILQAVDQLREQIRGLPHPTETTQEISGLKRGLLARADEAEREYSLGYSLLQEFRFQDAVIHLDAAIAAVPLPSFFLTLAEALRGVPNLPRAELITKQGLALKDLKPREDALLTNTLGVVLAAEGHKSEAQPHFESALKMAEKVYGPNDELVAAIASNLGSIMGNGIGTLAEAQRYAERALAIEEKLYGPGAHNFGISAAAHTLSVILFKRGDLAGAQHNAELALASLEGLEDTGADRRRSASAASDLSTILLGKATIELQLLDDPDDGFGPLIDPDGVTPNRSKAMGELAAAERYAERALTIEQDTYGIDNPRVTVYADNLVKIILLAKGEEMAVAERQHRNDPETPTQLERFHLELAQSNAERVLSIDQRMYGPDSDKVAADEYTVGRVLILQGDPSGARHHWQEAYANAVKRSGTQSYDAVIYAFALSTLKDKQ